MIRLGRRPLLLGLAAGAVMPWPATAADVPLLPYGGRGIGNDHICINLTNATLNSGRRLTYGGTAPAGGDLTGMIFMLASNQNERERSLRQKSAGEGSIAIGWELMAGADPLDGDGPAIVSRPGTVLVSGTLSHDRGGADRRGEARRWHRIRFDPPVPVEAGRYYHLRFTNLDPDPANNFVSLNSPTLRSARRVRSVPPLGMDPPRLQGPVGGDSRTTSLREQESVPDRYQRMLDAIPVFTWVYAGSDGERKLGGGYFIGENTLRNAALVGGDHRLRQRWRHTAGAMPVGDVWLYAHWPTAGGQPRSNLRLILIEEAGDQGDGWTRHTAAGPAAADRPSDTDPATVNGWSEGNDGTFADWTRLRFDADPPQLVDGRVYQVELISDDAERPYKLHPAQAANSPAQTRDEELATVDLWREDPTRPGRQAFAQRSADGGRTWSGFSLFGQDDRRDISLPVWLARG